MGFARRLARPYRLEEIREATILGILALHVGDVMVGIPPLADRTGVQEELHLFRGCQNSDLYIGDVELVRYSENVCPPGQRRCRGFRSTSVRSVFIVAGAPQ